MATKILIVEDDIEMNRLLALDLKRHGFEVITSTNGKGVPFGSLH